METKKTYKDSLFRAIFNDKERLAGLYKALSGNEVSPEEITINTLSGVFVNDIKNDISFCVGNKLIILMEHQSTWNPNMPLRFFWYLANLYKDLVDTNFVYKGSLVPIPAPEFYVLYNGTQDVPYFQELRLSNAFKTPSSCLELTANCYNINYAESKEVLDRCHDLMAYSVFVAKVREYVKSEPSLLGAMKKAIRYCASHDLMAEYFKNHESEVLDMISFEWDPVRAKEVAREEALEEGRIEGRIEGSRETATKMTNQFVLSLLANKAPMTLITATTHLSMEEVERIAREHQLAY